ncbi:MULTISPECIES: SRPBCC family protein [Streptomyces]|uniref:SRPBCC family protein n=2 Tax=Streptomyces rimosus subsp. rimosus TaxID=132474 RepID=L8ESN9_STRR1|nr:MULTISPECIES: SRPBCC family protein [Streptomyces]KOG71312.1 polyketide cyclase [Kitasatospora aureofaciens]MYT43005.1 SRPBCC family protein [Streptomyces sp. SID5471]KEF08921.1 polyketide cyclase [Streptomyces rimosus]KEF16959.1 polyketide cyclase [Streptomyces rimosus]KOT39189.1 polyketide cyclase [Streptomyces sp. NRRL WC-3701]
MAVRHQLIKRHPDTVWAVLADGGRYQDWVVGPYRSQPCEGVWPELGSTISYSVHLGPWSLSGRTVVRRCEPPKELELEVDSGALGTARIAVEIRPWGEHALVIMDEHPLQGPGGLLHNTVLDALFQLRHRSMLKRLARVVESRPRQPGEAV